ncbi:hypothetical protein B0T24DRAFT_664901 [Lasiosphaeria ovina]|uniref:FAD-binding domain-containing protein n=1 Tax=Lasiosphaeria ovina TaxID=92902 RepID=A0AAE0NAT7_9PEZI|nr:hypothetical protein B0T24DRAFT_664901 [Lasiosphaeria ovina]
MTSTHFKVIVVGGGPVGLTAAHALWRAGIDFVLLESRPSIVIDAGSNLVLLPMGLRLLGQLGLLEALNTVSSPLGRIQRTDHTGCDIGDANFFVHYKENHGIAPRVISRLDLTQVLYTTLPSEVQSCLLPDKRVATITTAPNFTTVHCTDGTTHTGSIIIGADGAHSLVRRQMRALALQAGSPPDHVNPEQPFLTTYQAMWVRFPTPANLTPGDARETHGVGAAVQLFAGEETSVIGVYERLASPTTARLRFGAAEEEAFIARRGNLPISAGLTIGDAYAARVQAGMVSLEEGVAARWSWDSRVVLVGDAAHKFTPSTGAGCNNGMVDVVVLVNQLRRCTEAGLGAPSKALVAEALAAYQDGRYAEVVKGCQGAGQATATATWKNAVFKFVDLHILANHRVQKMFMGRAAPAIARTPVLEFIEGVPMAGGKVAWAENGVQTRAVKAG